MTPEELKSRRMELLKAIVARAKGRADAKLPLSEIAPDLDIKVYAGGARFVDQSAPVYEGGNDQAYDFNTLRAEGLIEQTYMKYEQDRAGAAVPKIPAVRVTLEGLGEVAEANKSWLKKAIEQQPMTFVQIVVTVVIALATGIGGWAIGRYVTPAETGQTPVQDKAAK